MATVSDSQKATRRRAFGRRLIRKASDLSIMCGDMNSPDREFMTPKEREALAKLIDHLHKVMRSLDKLGTRLDES